MTVTDKHQMYRLLAAGAFGNTTPQYFSVAEWEASGEASRFPSWGVRTLTPGGPCRFYCPADEVPRAVAGFAPHRCNVSVMLDAFAAVTLWADVWDSPAGVVVYGIEYPRTGDGWTWRDSMPARGRHWEGTAARCLLRRHLNANSLADLWDAFDRFPGHVLELSAIDRCYGTVPHRNAVVWEVRMY